MRNLLSLILILVISNCFSQKLYKDLSNVMTIDEAKKELEENYSYKYNNIKLGDFPHLFEINKSYIHDVKASPLGEYQQLKLYVGLYHDSGVPTVSGNLVGVQLVAESDFNNIYEEAQQLSDFFTEKSYDLESLFGTYSRKELVFSDYGSNMLMVFKKDDLYIGIMATNLDKNKILYQIIIFNKRDTEYFKHILGVPEYVDDGFWFKL